MNQIKRYPKEDLHLLENHFHSDEPAIFETGLQNFDPRFWNINNLSKLVSERGLETGGLWFSANADFFKNELKMPQLVLDLLKHCYVRNDCQRIWLHKKGYETPFHIDGNLISIFSLQITGRKKWEILSPNTTEVGFYPFTFICDQAAHRAPGKFEFVLGSGDLLYLPAFWIHRVDSLDEENINLNLVGTKKQQSQSVYLAREKRLLSVFQRFPALTKALDKAKVLHPRYAELESYASGGGLDFIEELTQDISMIDSVKMILGEIANLKKVPEMLRARRAYMEVLDKQKVQR